MTMAMDERNRLIGENLRKYRLLKGLTQDELAEGLCSVSQLSKVENGKTYLKRTILKEMANRLGVTVERIESQDALLEELSETLQLARDSQTAGNRPKALEMAQNVFLRGQEFGYHELAGESLHLACFLLNEMNRSEEVIETINRAFADNLPLTDNQRLMFMYQLGFAFENSGNLMAAYDTYCRAESEVDEVDGDPETRYKIYYGLARRHFIMRNNRAAMRYFEKAEQVSLTMSRHLWRIRATLMKATMLKRMGDYKKAEALFVDVLKEAQDNQFLFEVGIVNNNMGCLYLERGEYGQASSHLNRALKVYEILKSDYYMCDTMLHLALLRYQEREFDHALELIDQLLAITDLLPKQTYLEKAKAMQLIGWIKRDRGEFEGYITQLEKALKVYDENRVVYETCEVAKELAEALYKNNDSRAVEMYRKAVQYNEKLLDYVMKG
jgi:tetratricopeptide (TPR) repeat protein